MKKACLEFAIRYKNWTIEDWKHIIWTNEINVILNQQRGNNQIQQTIKEGQKPVIATIQERYSDYTKFMFWECFLYDYKGPCYCWKSETAKEKKSAEDQIKDLNRRLEPIPRQEWELSKGTNRLGLWGIGDPKPVQKFTKATRAYVCKKASKNIDWWRYQMVILEPLLISFAKKCNIKQLLASKLPMLIQKDKTLVHASKYQDEVFWLHNIMQLLWPGNSPNMNMIELCWPQIKQTTTKKDASRTCKDANNHWQKAWVKLLQENIQAQIERIP